MLSPEGKAAGRAFRESQRAALAALNLAAATRPDIGALAVHAVVRHDCKGVSEGITLRAVTVASPEYRACYCGTTGPVVPGVFPHPDCDGSKVVAADGRFTFTWKEGRCSGCGRTVRSVDGLDAVAGTDQQDHERQAGPHPGDP